MLTRSDLVDLILQILRERPQAPRVPDPAPGPPPATAVFRTTRRVFLSEYEVKKLLTPQAQQLKIPRDAILSPLAEDWLVLKGIRIIREPVPPGSSDGK